MVSDETGWNARVRQESVDHDGNLAGKETVKTVRVVAYLDEIKAGSEVRLCGRVAASEQSATAN